MKSVVVYGPGDIRVEEKNIPQIEEDKVLIKVESCGICGTDLLLYQGKISVSFPYHNFGHEYCGEVVEVGSKVKNVSSKDRVVVNPNYWCGYCYFCSMGEGHLCRNKKIFKAKSNGGFSEYVLVSEKLVHKIPKDLSSEHATFVEPLSCCLHGMDMLNIKIGATAAILGGGTIGLLMLQLMKLNGCAKVILSEPIEIKRQVAKGIGADIVVNPLKEDLAKVVEANTPYGVDIVIECAGVSDTIKESFNIVRDKGTILFLALSDQKLQLPFSHFQVVQKELNIRGAVFGHFTHERAIELLSDGKIHVEPIITHRYRLNDIKTAIEVCLQGKAIKTLVTT
jgi:2-desacetyl-2-hydroxyethyl bacteriochlorophyllide A dehydrogenase